jgi:murein DD-endopeptidase
MAEHALSWAETFGLTPLGTRLGEMLTTFRGAAGVPPSRFDTTSLGIFQPRLALATWLGRRRADRRVPIYNLFNRTPTPIGDGWSVRRTQVRDFRGGTLTYDSHNGTDFAVPPGTTVVAAAAGRVLRVSSEFDRGGLKVFCDHGRGLVTTSNHLGRALVREGELVRRGQPIALSGASGIDMVLLFPWNVPHVHFNVWLNGEPVDPFATAGEVSLWRRTNDPVPYDGSPDDDAAKPTIWDPIAVEDAIAGCDVPEVRAALRAVAHPDVRAMAVLFQQIYYPTRFGTRRSPYGVRFPREPRLDLPFVAGEHTGIVFPD